MSEDIVKVGTGRITLDESFESRPLVRGLLVLLVGHLLFEAIHFARKIDVLLRVDQRLEEEEEDCKQT